MGGRKFISKEKEIFENQYYLTTPTFYVDPNSHYRLAITIP